MRLLEHELSYTELEGPVTLPGHSGSISREAMSQSLSHIMERRGRSLDHKALQHMIDFCLNTVTQSFRGAEKDHKSGLRLAMTAALDGVNNLFWDVKEALGMQKTEMTSFDPIIDVDKFASACSSTEPINFDDLVKLFEKKRHRSFLETFFMPLKLRQCLADAQPGTTNQFARRSSLRKSVSSMREHLSSLIGAAQQHGDTLTDLSDKLEMLCSRVGKLEQGWDEHRTSVRQLHSSVPEAEQSQDGFASLAQLKAQINNVNEQLETRMGLLEHSLNLRLEHFLESWSSIACSLQRDTTSPSSLMMLPRHEDPSFDTCKPLGGAHLQRSCVEARSYVDHPGEAVLDDPCGPEPNAHENQLPTAEEEDKESIALIRTIRRASENKRLGASVQPKSCPTIEAVSQEDLHSQPIDESGKHLASLATTRWKHQEQEPGHPCVSRRQGMGMKFAAPTSLYKLETTAVVKSQSSTMPARGS